MTSDRRFMRSTADAGMYRVLVGAVFSGLRPLLVRLLIDDGITAVSYLTTMSSMSFQAGKSRRYCCSSS
jgi:hypothetical protein